jgi:Protein of unknown function (DUF1348)
VRFQYECHDGSGQCWRSYGNELWEFTDEGLMRGVRPASTTSPSTRAIGGFAALALPASVDCCFPSGEPEIANIRGDFDE